MGYRLVNYVLDNAPAELSAAERLLLVSLAASADDKTRECWPGMATLTRRTGLSEDGVRRAFQRLAGRDLDPRVALGTDKRGRKVFAHEGTRTTYLIPAFKRGDESTATDGVEGIPERGDRSTASHNAEAGRESHHSEARGGTPVPQRRDSRISEAGREYRPEEKKELKEPHPPTPHAAAQDDPPSKTGAVGEAIATATPFRPDALALVDRLRAVHWFDEPLRVEFAETITRHQETGWTVEAIERVLMSGLDKIKGPGAWHYRLTTLGTPPTTGTATAPAGLPPVCDPCRDDNPAAEFNIKFRFTWINGERVPCPRCHPDATKAPEDALSAPQEPPQTPEGSPAALCECGKPSGTEGALCDRCVYGSEAAA